MLFRCIMTFWVISFHLFILQEHLSIIPETEFNHDSKNFVHTAGFGLLSFCLRIFSSMLKNEINLESFSSSPGFGIKDATLTSENKLEILITYPSRRGLDTWNNLIFASSVEIA